MAGNQLETSSETASIAEDLGTGTKLVLTDLHGPEASDMPEWNPVRGTIMVWVKFGCPYWMSVK